MIENFPLRRIAPDSKLKPFDCGNDNEDNRDLNDFFANDALNFTKELLTVTYTFEDEHKTVAFFSVLNDKIINKDGLGDIISNALTRKIPNDKRRPNYPSVMVGRLGVHKTLQSQGLGGDILDFIKGLFTDNNKTGCRFITVNAYNKKRVLNFYNKNGFKFLTQTDKSENTRLMYFDLKTFVR